MIIIHGVNTDTLPRHVAGSLRDRLNVMPAVVVTGARQTGKSTLAQDLTPGRRRFRSPVEVKATSRPRLGAAAHLRTFRAEYGEQARAGLLLHTGPTLEWLAPHVLAAPWWKVL